MNRAVVAVVLLGALATAGARGADERDDPAVGAVVFVRDGALWAQPVADRDAPAVRVAELPAGAEVRALAAAGDLVVIDVGGVAAWVQLAPGELRRTVVAPCTGPGVPAANGAAIACPGGAASVIVQPVLWQHVELAVPPAQVSFLGHAADELVVTDSDGLAALAVADPATRRPLAPHRPARELLIAPDGQRAVGRYEDGVFVFRLDGTAARRKLGLAEQRPAAWSSDSAWVLLDDELGACAMRAVGGENMCWKGYAALGFSPDSRFALLARDGALYVAAVEGVHAPKPVKLIDAAPVAAWVRW